MTARLRMVSVLGAVSMMMATAVAGTPARAAAAPASSITRAPAGVVVDSFVSVPRTLYQCPTVRCGRGLALPGNDLANACFFFDGVRRWDMVHNRANDDTGFIKESQLAPASPRSTQDCSTVPQKGRVTVDTPLYQCPQTFCNQAQVAPQDDVAMICDLHQGVNVDWIWTLDRSNQHEGFIFFQLGNLFWDGVIPPC
jgi:hypothetical protein